GEPGSAPVDENKVCDLLAAGQISVILKEDLDTKTMTVWYDRTGRNSFDESNPSASDIPVKLESIEKLRFLATGDVRPEGSEDYVAADHIRTAPTWEEIILPVSLAVHSLFQDHMVLQRDMDVPIWGRVTPGMEVAVQLDGVLVGPAVADVNGNWLARIGSHAADGGIAHVLQVSSGTQSIQLRDVVFGDVYLASGQSNMEFPMTGFSAGAAVGYSAERASADSFPLIRHVAVSRASAETVQDEPPLRINWTKCSSASLGSFSAVGYFFAKNIYEETGVPVGLLFSAWGGRRIERFLSPSGVEAVPELAGLRQYQEEGGITNVYNIYNAMIASLIPYGLRGVIWYQGESNGNDGNLYRYKMQALARGWRKDWGQGDFSFYYVQLANHGISASWPVLRETQLLALSETNSGMAVTIDIGNDGDIHPLNKSDVGSRLARWALVKDYGREKVFSGPLYRSASIEGSQIRVLFDYADGGLMVGQKESTNDVVTVSGPLENFKVAGADRSFVDADAVIDRDTVLVFADTVPSPKYVRYCFASAPAGANKLYNAAGLPASPFRTDETYVLQAMPSDSAIFGLTPGAVQTITASAQTGKVFDRWIGAASEISNLNGSTTTVTIPSRSLYLMAAYRDESESTYTLTVNEGYGSGTSRADSILNIEAASKEGQKFDHWRGDTQTVVNVAAVSTTLRMPANDVIVTAVYRTIDSVGDGVSDTWRAEYFGGDGSSTDSRSAADADPDGDGMTNEEEFFAGTSPIEEASVLRLGGSFSAEKLNLHFQGVDNRRYRLEKTDALNPVNWEVVLYNMTGNRTGQDLSLDLGDRTGGFYRLLLN
ncbi:MAG: sialate O-acetylesterase, partial [Kiritimatiellales bacterium]